MLQLGDETQNFHLNGSSSGEDGPDFMCIGVEPDVFKLLVSPAKHDIGLEL